MPVRRMIALLLATAVAAACGAPGPTAAPVPTPEVLPFEITIAPGVRPRMAPAEVALVAMRQITLMENLAGVVLRPARIISVKALQEVAAFLEIGAPGNGGAAIVWLVRGEGTFATNRGAPFGAPPPPAPTGYFMISDADGTIAGMGFPFP